MVKRYRHISELTTDDIALFTRVLRLPDTARLPADGSPSQKWLARQAEKVSQLPSALQRPKNNWLERLSVYTNERLNLTIEDIVPQCAVLCSAHRGLNPWAVHGVFLLLSEEVTRRLDPLRRYLIVGQKEQHLGGYEEKDKEEEEGLLPAAAVELEVQTSHAEIRSYVDRMNALLSLWTGPEVLARIVGGDGGERDDYSSAITLPRVRSNCEACIVACVGARPQALCDLRAMMCGRSHRRRRPPALLRLVEAWIERIGGEDAERLRRESAVMAKDVRRIRRMVMMARRSGQRRKHRHHNTTPCDKRETERVRMERDLDRQKLSASQRRIALGEIDRRLDEMFAGVSREKGFQQGTHSSTFASASKAPFSKNANKPGRYNDDSTAVDTQEQTSRSSWEDYSFIVDESRGHNGQQDIEPFPDYHDDELDEADPYATYRLQDQIQSWYDRYTEVGAPANEAEANGYTHPAFSQTLADVKDHLARSQMALSAVPSPLHFKKLVYLQHGDIDDYDEWAPTAARDDASEWTDVSVHTLATRSKHNSIRGVGQLQGEVPPVPRVTSVHRNGVTAVTAFSERRSGAHNVLYSPPSSVYSNEAPTALHPPPAASTVLPATAYPMPHHSGHQSWPAESAANSMAAQFENPRTPPRVPGSQRRRGRPEATRGPDMAMSETTHWPSPHGTGAPSSGSGYRHTSSSASRRSRTSTPDTALSSREFQAGLDHMNDDPYGVSRKGGDIIDENTTILPGDSVSAVGRLYRPEEPDVTHRYRLRRDQISADEALARQLAWLEVRDRPRYDTDYNGV